MHKQDKCTIYKLINKVNKKIYIGQSWLPLHLRMGPAGCNYSHSIYLYNAIKKYGAENFEYETIETVYTQEEADFLEKRYIEEFNSRNSDIGYNLKEGGSHGKHSEETRQKISNSIKNKVWSEEALEGKRKAGKAWLGKKRGPLNEERKLQKSMEMTEWHANNTHPMEGKHHTDETKQKISDKLMGHPRDPASVRRGAEKIMMPRERENAIINDYQNNIPIKTMREKFETSSSEIYRVIKRNNIPKRGATNTQLGKTHSEASKQKMSEVKTEWWKNKKQSDE